MAIYTGGGMIASLLAGAFADWIGRKKMMVAGGLMFVTSIFLIYTSQGLVPLVLGRILMGLSGGVICVVVPLYMAECLPSRVRGRGTSIFQFMLTGGIAAAAAIGMVFARQHDAAIKAGRGRNRQDLCRRQRRVAQHVPRGVDPRHHLYAGRVVPQGIAALAVSPRPRRRGGSRSCASRAARSRPGWKWRK